MSSIFGRSVIISATNKSGGSVVAGDVVIFDSANNLSFTTTTSAGVTTPIGIAQEAIANNAAGRVLVEGYAALVNVNASVTRLQYGKTHTVAKQAAASATRVAGTFCTFLSSGTTPDALVYPVDLAGAALTNPMSAVGDIIQGTTAGAPAALAAPLAGKVLTGAGVTTPLVYAYPPGYIFSEVTYTDVSVTGTTEGGAQTVATSGSFACDGVFGVIAKLNSPRLIQGTAAGNGMVIDLYLDSTIQGRWAVFLNPASAADDQPLQLESLTIVPSNASHTMTAKAWRIGANGTISGGAGGTGANMAGWFRVSKA